VLIVHVICTIFTTTKSDKVYCHVIGYLRTYQFWLANRRFKNKHEPYWTRHDWNTLNLEYHISRNVMVHKQMKLA